jgi:hypothetical protein
MLLTSRTQTLPRMLAQYGKGTGKQVMPLSDEEGAEFILSLNNSDSNTDDASSQGSPPPAGWDIVDKSDATDTQALAESLTS